MPKSAAELADLIIERKLKATQRAYEALKAKVISGTSKMVAELADETEIEITDEDALGIEKIAEELREAGYRFCLIERQDSSGEIKSQALRISIGYLI